MVAEGSAALVWRRFGDSSVPVCHAVALDDRRARTAGYGTVGASTGGGIPGAEYFRTLRALWWSAAGAGPGCAPLCPPHYVFGYHHDCGRIHRRGFWLESRHAVVVDAGRCGFLLAFLRRDVVVPTKNPDGIISRNSWRMTNLKWPGPSNPIRQSEAPACLDPQRATRSVLIRERDFAFVRVVATSCSTFRITASRSLTFKGLSKCASNPAAWLFSMSSLQP